MSSTRLTRRRFIITGAASAAGIGAAGIGLDAARAADSSLIVGEFVRADGPRDAVVSTKGGTVSVTLDSGAFVAHGADGIVDTLAAFVPGEQVVVRGGRANGKVVAVELQSVYSAVSGTYSSDGTGHWLVTASGRVRVPPTVLHRDAPRIAAGETRRATIWTHPSTHQATAVGLDH
ncbi:MAG: hypothetical protein QOF50_1540 [Gaiellaceae bacterium]|jgi:hypothetical protein|nr:hypothetical protein [Gaiellaceae bacterium]